MPTGVRGYDSLRQTFRNGTRGPGADGSSWPANFTPLSLSPFLYVQSNIAGSIVIGTNVSQWTDQTSNHRDLVQATGANQPVKTASDANLGNQPSVALLNSTTNVARAQAFPALPMTVFLVGWQALSAGAEILSDAGHFISIGINSTGIYAYAGSSLSSSVNNANGHAICAVFNGASSQLYVDSSTSGITSGTTGANGPSGAIQTGGPFSNTSGGIGMIVIIPGTITASQVSSLMQYATQRGYGGPWS